MINGLTHIAVRITDLQRSLAFYTGVLGLRETWRYTSPEGQVILVYLKVADGQFIELFPVDAAVKASDDGRCGYVHICLQVDDIQAAYERITGAGVPALYGEPTLQVDESWQFWVADPDGNPIEFHQFTPKSIQLL